MTFNHLQHTATPKYSKQTSFQSNTIIPCQLSVKCLSMQRNRHFLAISIQEGENVPLVFKFIQAMKNPSREKAPATQPAGQNRLNKTQVPPKPAENFENTYYGQSKNTVEPRGGQLPPRAGSSQKINYKVEENMTNSKIQEARKGLQLLKKKMSRNGMSREKNGSVERQDLPEQLPSKKTIYRPQNEEDEYQEVKKPSQRTIDKQPSREDVKKTPPVPSRNIASEKSPPIPTKSPISEDRPIRRPPPKSEFVNEAEQVPLKANQDFFALLQRQMAKESSKGGKQEVKPAKRQASYDEEEAEIQLAECSKGCGRQFNVEVLPKHEKVCEKVFQSKRKAFNAAAQRAPEVEDFKQPPPPPPPVASKAKKTPPPGKEKIPKWKLQSVAFRAGIKAGRGEELTAEQKAATQQSNPNIQCNFCGRKFNPEAGKRHIPHCETKFKQVNNKIVKKR